MHKSRCRCVGKTTGGGETSQALGIQGLGVKGPVPHMEAICQEQVTSSLIAGTSS